MTESITKETCIKKIKELLQKLEALSQERRDISDRKEMSENAAEKMCDLLSFVPELRKLMKETHFLREYEMLFYSWKRYAFTTFISFSVAYDEFDRTVNPALLDIAFSSLDLFKKAVHISYNEISSNPDGNIRIADLYYSTVEGLKMNTPGLFFAHCNEKYDYFPIKISAYVTGGDRFWGKYPDRKRFLYLSANYVTRQAITLLQIADLSKIGKAAEIIHDYGDYVAHSGDVFADEYIVYCSYSEQLSRALYDAAKIAEQDRTKAINKLQGVVSITEAMKWLN